MISLNPSLSLCQSLGVHPTWIDFQRYFLNTSLLRKARKYFPKHLLENLSLTSSRERGSGGRSWPETLPLIYPHRVVSFASLLAPGMKFLFLYSIFWASWRIILVSAIIITKSFQESFQKEQSQPCCDWFVGHEKRFLEQLCWWKGA